MDNEELKCLKGLRVLVVDDNILNQRLTSQILMQWQVSANVAENGKMALEMLSKDVYDVVLMDLIMPEFNGYDATRVVRSRERTYYRNLPIFAFTANPDPEKIKECSMNGYITSKPLNKDELFTKISPFLK